jgi:AraC-like DNA-binding protein
MRYIEVPPSAALAAGVECVWSIEGRVGAGEVMRNRVLPDGCMDVIFDLGDRPRSPAPAHHALEAYVVGAMREALIVSHVGRVDLLGVRFRPGAAVAFLDVSADELTGMVAELRAFWRDALELTDRVSDASEGTLAAGSAFALGRLRARAAIIEGALLRHSGHNVLIDPVIGAATSLIERSGGTMPVGEIERRLGVGSRTLERRFASAVGLSPKAASRVARFRAAARLIAASSSPSLARIAAGTGYHDQAHFTRDFRSLAGLPPAAYLRERRDGFVQDNTLLAD